jgi:hypothetical protein
MKIQLLSPALNEDIDRRWQRRAVSDAEFGQLIAAAEKSADEVRELAGPDRAMLYAFAGATGLRVSDIDSLKTDSLQLGGATATVIVEASYSKRRKR